MKVLIVYAHPQPRSLTGSLKDLAVARLRADGHEVVVSDLYAMGWKSAADMADFGANPGLVAGIEAEPRFMFASGKAYHGGGLSPDIAAEQRKLLWADTVLLHFPLWWFSMPAIMKGWVDRVLTLGFGYGDGGRGAPRYGSGTLAGRRAMLVVSIGGKADSYSDRGINGPIDDLLFPINHGIVYYTGMQALPPFVVHGTIRVDSARYTRIATDLTHRLSELDEISPIPYRPQAGGDYDLASLELKEGGGAPGGSGFSRHIRPR